MTSFKGLSGETLTAIATFYQIEKKEKKLEELREFLEKLVASIPEKEMETYVELTTKEE